MTILIAKNPVYITGPCSVLPERMMSNQDMVEWTHSTHSPVMIAVSTGIRNRHWADDNEACSDLAFRAANKLLEKTACDRQKISQVILATISGDYPSPPTSPLVQHRLGLKNAGAFDLGAACAGFVTGLHTSAALNLATGGDILLIASDIRSKFINKDHFASAVLFGDGAAACLVTTDKLDAQFRFIASSLYSDGEVGDLVAVPAGGSRLPAANCNDPSLFYINIKENTALFVKAVTGMSETAKLFLDKLGIQASDIDWLVPHQGNKHLVLSVAKQLGIPMDKVIDIVETTGNTSGASVGIALAELNNRNKVMKGDKILLVSAGGGGMAASALLEAM